MYRPLVPRSRELRKTQTPQETWLWGHLRNRQLHGLKFYRQYAIEPYIADFCCPEKRVILELDGSGHLDPKQAEHDKERDTFLKSKGYRIFRILNSDWNKDHRGVLEQIATFALCE